LIVGAGGHAQVVADILLRCHEAGEPSRPIGLVDDTPDLEGQRILGLPVLGSVADVSQIDHDDLLVAPGASVVPERSLGVWTIVGAGAAVTANLPAHATTVGVPAKETGGLNGCEE
jgi:FlaA1/EpsC-like NDP-sugar epimerase